MRKINGFNAHFQKRHHRKDYITITICAEDVWITMAAYILLIYSIRTMLVIMTENTLQSCIISMTLPEKTPPQGLHYNNYMRRGCVDYHGRLHIVDIFYQDYASDHDREYTAVVHHIYDTSRKDTT
eukprot:33121_1